MKNIVYGILVILVLPFTSLAMKNASTPDHFVYLRDIDPSIQQDIRYATSHNFIGSPIKGYSAAECILTRPAAEALSKVQKELLQSGLTLRVFDCYRPQMAVDEFIAWSKIANDQKMKNEFYPRVNKADFFTLGYVAARSGHTRGSTMDLTIALKDSSPIRAKNSQKLISCLASYQARFHEGIDMGTGFDCMDPRSHHDNTEIPLVAYYHRMMLKALMMKYGFEPYQSEWWHFTLKNEPFPDQYFNFPIGLR